LFAPFKLIVAIWDALRALRQRQPGVVLGMGGFASGPGGFAAWLLRCPLVIHEQNAAAGLTNRLLAGLAREVLEAFPGSFSPSRTTQTIGNPVRREIFLLARPEERMARREGPLRVLVLGGSQGALALNNTLPVAVAMLPERIEVDVWHQAGPATLDTAVEVYKNSGVEARVDAFISDIDEAYAWADMVVCRSGALTVCELAAAGLGAVLVPYPAAVDDHQTLNARYLVDAGAAVLIPQSELTPERLAVELEACAKDRRLVLQRASRARQLSRPEATDDLVAACLAQEAA
jgi:UDP-N-acetylglucosamine--N-acetylmuramyl-(pentapeptide) pyrophosphoryl-undecaprenol N-acetylglucosamine transferase